MPPTSQTAPPDGPLDPARIRRHHAGRIALVVAATFLAYANSLNLPFVFDDLAAIVRNDTLHSLATAWQPPGGGAPTANRPLVNASFAVNYALGGESPRGYHLANLLIHTLAGLALFGLVRRTLQLPALRPRWGAAAGGVAFAAALLWCVHPLQTESVTAVSQRTESLCGLLYLTTFYLFVRGATAVQPWRWWTAAALACTAGMTAKEVMVTAPVLLVLFDRTFLAGSYGAVWRERRLIHGLFFASWGLLAWILLGAGGARGSAAGFGLGVEWWQYSLKQCEAVLLYLRLALVPHPLVHDYGTAVAVSLGEVWWQAPGLALLVAATLWALVRQPAAGFLGAWFFVVLSPSSSVVPLVEQTVAEHRMYLPLAAVTVAAALALHRWWRRPAFVVTLALGAAGIFLTADRNRDYRSERDLWADTAAKVPGNMRAHYNLASILLEEGRAADALPYFERALRLAPADVGVLNNYGNALRQLGRLDDAAAALDRAVALNPGLALAHFNLAHVRLAAGRSDAARAALETALRLDPDLADAAADLGHLHLQAGRADKARRYCERALHLNPGLTVARRNLGVAWLLLGQFDDARSAFERVLAEAPGDPVARQGLDLARRRIAPRL